MPPFLRPLLRAFGSVLAVASVVFVALKLREYSDRIDFSSLGSGQWLGIGALTIIYGAAGFGLAAAWREALAYLKVDVSMKWAYWAHGVSQLAKYVPGNIFQFAGRQAVGAHAGIRNAPLVKSALWELALIAGQGAFFLVLVLPLALCEDPGSAYIAASVTFFAFLTYIFGTIAGRRLGAPVRLALRWYAGFLIVTGLLFVGSLMLISPGQDPILPVVPGITGAYVAAWLAGLLTPGAPAGVGVRELVLFALLRSVVETPALLSAIVIARLITVGGDLIYFLAASAVGRITGVNQERLSTDG